MVLGLHLIYTAAYMNADQLVQLLPTCGRLNSQNGTKAAGGLYRSRHMSGPKPCQYSMLGRCRSGTLHNVVVL